MTETPIVLAEHGLCSQVDPEAFFPERGTSASYAQRVCASCPVRQLCLDWALDNDERFGVWGGLTEHERRRIRRARVVEEPEPVPQPKPAPRGPVECGTRRGYHRHRSKGEPACDPCRHANAAADRRLRTTGSTLPAA